MSAGNFPTNPGGFYLINTTYPSQLLARVVLDGSTYVVDTPVADTSLNGALTGKTTAELLARAGKEGNFGFNHSRALYRKAGAAGATSVKLAKVVRNAVINVVATITTTVTTSTRTFRVGTEGSTSALLASQATSVLSTSSSNYPKLWAPTSPKVGPPNTSTVGETITYYSPDIFVAGGQDIILTIGSEDGTVLEAGDITFEIFGASISQFNLRNSGTASNTSDANGAETSFVVVPLF